MCFASLFKLFFVLLWLPTPHLKDKWTFHLFVSHTQMNRHTKLWSHPSSIPKMNRTFLPRRLVLFHELRLGFTFIMNSCTQTINITSNNINTLKSYQKHIPMWTKSRSIHLQWLKNTLLAINAFGTKLTSLH